MPTKSIFSRKNDLNFQALLNSTSSQENAKTIERKCVLHYKQLQTSNPGIMSGHFFLLHLCKPSLRPQQWKLTAEAESISGPMGSRVLKPCGYVNTQFFSISHEICLIRQLYASIDAWEIKCILQALNLNILNLACTISVWHSDSRRRNYSFCLIL